MDFKQLEDKFIFTTTLKNGKELRIEHPGNYEEEIKKRPRLLEEIKGQKDWYNTH